MMGPSAVARMKHNLFKGGSTVEIYTLKPGQIIKFLDRKKKMGTEIHDVKFDELFEAILTKANEFVPSEAGSVLLDDPQLKRGSKDKKDLAFIACFGPRAKILVGQTVPANLGFSGKTYISGIPIKSNKVREEKIFFDGVDSQVKYETRSILSVPILIEKAVCGVLELVNKKSGEDYTDRELELLKIFAGYISISLQNALEAKRNRELSTLDDLTGLRNDRFFYHMLAEDISEAEKKGEDLGLLFMDLDFLKTVNDRWGHLSGSQVLREVGAILPRVVRVEGATISRYGGDEFVLLLPGCDSKKGVAIAEDIRKAIEKNIFVTKSVIEGDSALNLKGVITCSIGVASYMEHVRREKSPKRNQNMFISLADQAMYKAKEQGKNRVILAKP
jgi:diguanylate cyclase (GGDEF)-like protein